MFYCQKCGVLNQVGQPINKVVTESREKTYVNTYRKNEYSQPREFETKGWEIVKEIKTCPKCYTELTGKTPQVVQEKEKPVKEETQPRQSYRESQRKKPVVEVVNRLK
jgi:hypothetical protein